MANLNLPSKPHIILIITDQQSWIPEWMNKETRPKTKSGAPLPLPAMDWLLDNGLAFSRAHCNSATCSSSRATLFTSTYPAHHRVTQVLAFDDPANPAQTAQQFLSSNDQNMARMMATAGYEVAYKGKWHITKPARYVKQEFEQPSPYPTVDIDQLYWTRDDVDHIAALYGFNEWNYPDAGDDGNIYNFGGGRVNNDGRFVDGSGQSAKYGSSTTPPAPNEQDKTNSSVLNYIATYDSDKPLFLVVSLVNPHDVLSYPGGPVVLGEEVPLPLYKAGGYLDYQFNGIHGDSVGLPVSWDEDLKTKPKIQTYFRQICQQAGCIKEQAIAENYVKFYAYLMTVVDGEIKKVLDALGEKKIKGKSKSILDESVIVRISDHGDMGMAHGLQRQKMFNVYRETLNVPMIFASPAFDQNAGMTTQALAGLIDLMPTLADIAGMESEQLKAYQFQGKSLLPVLLDPTESGQDYLHFTYDDDYITGKTPQTAGASHIRCIVQEERDQAGGLKNVWKYAVYFDPNYGQRFEYEMYDLTNDSAETKNLATATYDEEYGEQRQWLHQRLIDVMDEYGTLPDSVVWPTEAGVQLERGSEGIDTIVCPKPTSNPA